MTIMRRIDFEDRRPGVFWLECRVCGHKRMAELAPPWQRDYKLFKWGTLSRCWNGCTQEMLRAKLRAGKEGQRLMAETSKRHWTEADKERSQALKIAGARARARRIEERWKAEDRAHGGHNV